MAQLKATTVNGAITVKGTSRLEGNVTVTGTGGTGTGTISANMSASNLNTGTVSNDRLNKATTAAQGIVQLNDATNSTATNQAATANAVKKANDNANTRLKLDGTTTMTGQLKVNATQGINFGNDDTITYNDTDNRFEFKADNGTASKVKAGTFEGALSGKANTAGTADQANKWTTARTITLGGDLTGSVSINGTANVVLNAEVKNDSHGHGSLDINNTEVKNVGRLQVFQKQNDTTINPDSGWWSVVRAQHSGYVNGYWQDLAMSFNGDSLRFRRNVNGTITPWKTIAFTDSSVSGNAGSATKLQTARQINGTNFDGTAAITTAKWGTARTITLGGDLSGSVSLDGSANVTLSGQVADNSHNHSSLKGIYNNCTIFNDHSNGNVTICGSKNSGGTVGDLYVGYNSGDHATKDVLLCRNMKWQSNGAILVDSNGKIPWSSLTGLPSTWAPSAHTHDDRYYTEGEMNTKLNEKANTSGTYSGLRVGKDIIHDTRGANRPPSYYDRQSVRYDFVEGSQIGWGGNWTTLMTISPWSSYNNSHRQVQLGFQGNDLITRYATSDGAWSGWGKIYHSNNKPSAADIGAAAASHSHAYLPTSGGTMNLGSAISWNCPGDEAKIYAESGNNVTSLCLQTGDDGGQDSIKLRNRHWEQGVKDVAIFERDNIWFGANLIVHGSHVVSSGSNGNGYYVRYYDGTQICWRSYSGSFTISNAYGPLFQNSGVWTYPASFSGGVTAGCTQAKWGTSGSWGGISDFTNATCNWRAWDCYSRGGGTTHVSLFAIGRWK